MTAEPLNPYTESCRDAIKSSSANLGKTFENLLVGILLLYTVIHRKKNSHRWSVTVTIASRATERITIAAGLCASTGVSYGLWTFCPWCRASCAQPPARQFVEYFIKKWPQKWHFKTFNIEKNNRQTYCKQTVILCVLSFFSTKKRALNDKRHYFACLPTCY